MAKMENIFAKLKEELEAEKEDKNKVNENLYSVTTIEEINLKNNIIALYKREELQYIDEIISDEETRNFLKENTIKLLIQDNLNKLALGKILQDVFDKIGNFKDGEYGKWLFKTGINERTALRYRNKYNFFRKLESESAKKNLLKMSHELIETLMKDERLEKQAIKLLEQGSSVEDIKTFIDEKEKNETIELPDKVEPVESEITIDNISEEIKNKWDTISKGKKRKVENLFKRIRKILGE